MGWQGKGDSRPECDKPRVGSIDRTGPPKKVSYNPTGSEVSGAKRGGVQKVNWKGRKDNR